MNVPSLNPLPNPLHLFRALLRQCTYLPDPAARTFLRSHIVSRFREFHPRSKVPQSVRRFSKKSRGLDRERRVAVLRTARKGLVFLQRANDGHPRHLGKILAMAYGRAGKRRHELLSSLRVPDVPVDKAELDKLMERTANPATQGLPQPSRQLLALVESQATRKKAFFPRSQRPTMEPEIPEKNAWGRPMPIKRVRNLNKKWYGETLDLLMPPLPEAEWARLRGLASGETKWEGPRPRRGQNARVGFKSDIVRGTLVIGTGTLSGPHELTPRYMRRLWTKIFAQCPLMIPNASERFGWEIKWGDLHGTRDVTLQTGVRADLAMFEGVSERGKVLRNTKQNLAG